MKSLQRFVIVLVALSPLCAVSEAQMITEFPLPTADSGPFRIVAGPDGALWFTEWFGNKIGRITTHGLITEFPIPGRIVSDIALGSDGRLWFTEPFANTIGAISTYGLITEYPIPWTRVSCGFLCVRGAPHPYAIADGPDGNLWFTETGTGKIGRITTSGTITEFRSPPGIGASIVAGPDDALWFAFSTFIGRISTEGLTTFFELPSGKSVESIAVGPDGALWFPIQYGGSIGRMTVNGELKEFPIPSTIGFEFHTQIVAGADGNLWFTGRDFAGGVAGDGGLIGRMTTEGRFTEFPLTGADAGIAAGPDGALWLTEWCCSKIGRITTGIATPRLIPNDRQPRVVPFH